MFALGLTLSPLPPLRLDLDSQWLRLCTQDRSTALKRPLVDVGCTLHSVISATNDTGTVQAQHISGNNAGHLKWQANLVALLDKVRKAVDMDGDVVAWLSSEEGQKSLHGVVNWLRRLGGVALLEGQRTDLVLGRIWCVVDMRLRNGLDDWRSGVEASRQYVTTDWLCE